jgi:4-amino-4-deoxy-L-arabinose transferase-like glycosyltransferase
MPPPSRPAILLRRYWGLAIVLVGALAVRAAGLTDWWLNADEGIYYSLLTRGDLSGFWAEVMGNAHPPLYYLILRALGLFTWNFTWFRVLSLFFGLVAVVGVWAATRELVGDKGRDVAGLVAAVVLAFSPEAIQLSQVIRPYMFQLALLSGALWLLLRYLDRPSDRDLAWYVVLVVLALLTHYSSILALAVFGLVVAHDGLVRGASRPEWRSLATWHLVPVAVVGLLYVLHLRQLTGGSLADEALDGWLDPYMVGSVFDAWNGFLGYQSYLVTEWARGPAALLFIVACGVSLVTRDLRPAILGLGAVAIAVAVSAVGAYPFGSTRHSSWQAVFTVPVLAWLAAWIARRRRLEAFLATAGVALVLAMGAPLGRLIGTDDAVPPLFERALERESLTLMVDALDPQAEPRLIIMSAQTFYVLLPFYASERNSSVVAPDSSAFHFPYGSRQIVTARAWNLTAGPDVDAPDHLVGLLRLADASFPELAIGDRQYAALFVGGFLAPIINELNALSSPEQPIVLRQRAAPGLFAFVLDLQVLRAAFAPETPP